jgi:hypothetical protein
MVILATLAQTVEIFLVCLDGLVVLGSCVTRPMILKYLFGIVVKLAKYKLSQN